MRRVRGGGGSRNASRSRLSLSANAEDGGVTIGRVPEDVRVGVDVDVDRDGDRGNDDGDWRPDGLLREVRLGGILVLCTLANTLKVFQQMQGVPAGEFDERC